MHYLNKLWVRILLSLLIGGMLSEFNHIRTGSAELSNVLFRIGAVAAFILFSIMVWLNKLRYYYFPKKEEAEGRDDLLDDV